LESLDFVGSVFLLPLVYAAILPIVKDFHATNTSVPP